MHTTQKTYIAARAALDLVLDAYNKRLDVLVEALDEDPSASDLDAFDDAEDALHTELEVDRFERALRDAEDAMIDWSIASLERRQASHPQLAAALNTLKVGRSSWRIRPRVVDLAARLTP